MYVIYVQTWMDPAQIESLSFVLLPIPIAWFFPEDQPLLTETKEEKTSLNISIYI